jgi:hypothetical protein
MANTLPREVVIDHDKAHHVCVSERRDEGWVEWSDLDTKDSFRAPLDYLPKFKQLLRNNPEYQVLSWLVTEVG